MHKRVHKLFSIREKPITQKSFTENAITVVYVNILNFQTSFFMILSILQRSSQGIAYQFNLRISN